jgi:DNA adenine methylase
MTTPITYYGGKQRLADTIIGLIPAHKIYVEPFFGGGAVFFRKRKSYLEAINDRNDLLIYFYYVVQNHFDELKELVDNTLLSERMFLHARDITKSSIENHQSKIENAWALSCPEYG